MANSGNDSAEPINQSRRGFLKLTRGAAIGLAVAGTVAALGGASGYRWWQKRREPGFRGMLVLREQDILLFSALLPVIVGAHPGTHANAPNREALLEKALRALDKMLAASSPAMQKQIFDLADLLTIRATQGPATGYWGSWNNASEAQISAFLTRWRDSRVNLFRFGYAGLCQLLQMAWYGLPDTWLAIGYLGPPPFLRGPLDARS